MADDERPPFHKLMLGLYSEARSISKGVPLSEWPNAQEPAYKYLFAVNVTDTDPMNLACEIRRGMAPVNRQLDLTKAHFDAVLAAGQSIPTVGIDLMLPTNGDSLVMLHLAEQGVTLEHPDHVGDVAHVILRDAAQPDMIYQARWLAGSADKTISFIVHGHKPGETLIHYALRVRSEAGANVSHTAIDPKVENEGDG